MLKISVFYSYLKSSYGSDGLLLKGTAIVAQRSTKGIFSLVAKPGNQFAVVQGSHTIGTFTIFELKVLTQTFSPKGRYLSMEVVSPSRGEIHVEGFILSENFAL